MISLSLTFALAGLAMISGLVVIMLRSPDIESKSSDAAITETQK
ncbi:hypothetical protein [Acidisphaera sp. L21]|nr:hypothetical protein [Acidisphaera sp. L21]